jgi:hypothetical protein
MKTLILTVALLIPALATGCRMCCDDHPSRSYRLEPASEDGPGGVRVSSGHP